MEAKKIYSYHIDTEDVKNMIEVGPYFVSHRIPLTVGDYVVLEVYPKIPDENPSIEQMMWSQDNPPEYCVLGKVSRFSEDGLDVFFILVGAEK